MVDGQLKLKMGKSLFRSDFLIREFSTLDDRLAGIKDESFPQPLVGGIRNI